MLAPGMMPRDASEGRAVRLFESEARTGFAWLIALGPTIQILFWIVVVDMNVSTSWTEIYGLAGVGLVVNVFLANSDISVLSNRGFESLPSKYWALLPPLVYLWMRGSRTFDQSQGGLRPFWALVVQCLAWPLISLFVQLWGGAGEQLSQH
jgi:hypothetical protein